MKWEIVFTKQAQKDAKKIAKSGLKQKAQHLLDILSNNPLHIQHRLVYQIYKKEKIVKVISLRTHYE